MSEHSDYKSQSHSSSHSHSHSHSHSSNAASQAASSKKVSFALPSTHSHSTAPHEHTPADLGESLLSGSFTDSDCVQLHEMSDKRLKDDKKAAYSSLSQDMDDDMPPPLEEPAVYASRNHNSRSTRQQSLSASPVAYHGSNCDNASHSSSSNHGHSHGGRLINKKLSRSNSSSASPIGSQSPDNCGGLKNREKTSKAEEANRTARRQLSWAALCCFIFMICEIIGGFIANSLAIMTDAAHLLSDLAGFLISIFALWLATRPATSRLSFGFHRAEILGALISVILIWLLTGILVYEACWRLAHPEDVDGKLMFIVAALGLVCNGIMGMVLMQSGHGHSHGLGGGHDHSHGGDSHGHSHGSKKKAVSSRNSLNSSECNDDDGHGHLHGACESTNDHGHSHGGDDHGHSHGGDDHGHSHSDHDDDEHSVEEEHHENLNVKAAFIHVLGDALQSFGVMIAASLIWYNPEWRVADPVCTFLFSILVLFTTTRLIKQSVGVLMEGVPEGIVPDEVEESLLTIRGVIAVHDLHIWSLSVGKPALSVHLYCRDDASNVLAACNKLLGKKYNIHHSTIQIERQHDEIECNDAFVPGHASLDRITSENFGELGLSANV